MPQYAILVTGAREWTNRKLIFDALQKFATDRVILIHGDCVGVDKMAGLVATELKFNVEVYPAEWRRYGRAAGPVRNRQMVDKLLEYREAGMDIAAFAFHNNINESRGTKQCVSLLTRENIKYTLVSDRQGEVPSPSTP